MRLNDHVDGAGPKVCGAARQLIEEARSILISNLTNLGTSHTLALQFYSRANELGDGLLTRGEFRKWVRQMLSADAFAGLDHSRHAAEVCAGSGSTLEVEMKAFSRDTGDSPICSIPTESWTKRARLDHQTESGSDFSTVSVDTISTEANSHYSVIDPSSEHSSEFADEDVVSFEEFKKACDALSLKALLRMDIVRHEVPVSEEPCGRCMTLSPGGPPTLWHCDLDDVVNSKNPVQRAWEESYATGQCIWVIPEADQDVYRVLREGWFDTSGLCLELGCGLGFDAVALAEAGFDVVGVDISSTAIHAARHMSKAKALQGRVSFLCGDAYELPTPTRPLALLWDNTLFQNAQRGDHYGARCVGYNSLRYKELILRLTVPGSLVMMNVMSSELTECHAQFAQRGFFLPLTSAMRVIMEFVEFFEFIFFRNGVYDMNSLFIDQASDLGYFKPADLGGLPSWCVLMRRRPEAKPCSPPLPSEQDSFTVAEELLARDGFQRLLEPKFLRRLVEQEWGEHWGAGPKSDLLPVNNEKQMECGDAAVNAPRLDLQDPNFADVNTAEVELEEDAHEDDGVEKIEMDSPPTRARARPANAVQPRALSLEGLSCSPPAWEVVD